MTTYDQPIQLQKPTYRDNICAKCGVNIPLGTVGVWLYNKAVYHAACMSIAPATPTVNAVVPGSTPSPTVSPPGSPPPIRCATCRVFVPANDMTNYAFTDGRDPVRVCSLCARIATAQYQLKLLGLWKTPRKQSIKLAAEAMGYSEPEDTPDEGQTKGDG